MTDRDFHGLLEFRNISGSALIPVNQKSTELLEQSVGQSIALKEVTARDVNFHRAYFGLLGFVWDWTTPPFKQKVPKGKFYKWLKHLQGKYKVIYEFTDGTRYVEYESISFGRMSQKRFEEYTREQLSVIYEDLIRQLYDTETANTIIENIEHEFENFLLKL